MVERVDDGGGLDVRAVDVVEVAVPGLGDDGEQPALGEVAVAGDGPVDDAAVHGADGVGVGQPDGQGERAGLVQPGGAGHLAVAVEAVPPGGDRDSGLVLAEGVHDGDPGAHRPGAGGERPVPFDDRVVADLDAGHVGDGVPAAGFTVEGDAQAAGAGFARGGVGLRVHAWTSSSTPGAWISRMGPIRTAPASSRACSSCGAAGMVQRCARRGYR